ncbi:MAG: hypothetical protein L6264_05810 [Weeksellaceae bacterium]|nr:hypothetical protein [Bacteroidota bacterium]MCG2780446.1 hypothetical protein [Weeksellaceae bacterium]
MKKIILGVALASLVISCKKIQAGSNKGVLKMEEGAERYSDDVIHGDGMPAATHETTVAENDSVKLAGAKETAVKTDSAKVEAKPAAANSGK